MTQEKEYSPAGVLSLAGGCWEPCALHCGVKLGVFTLLADGPRTAAKVARQLNAPERGVRSLLNALAAMELLEKREDRFQDTAETRLFLDKKSPRYVGHMVMHHHHLVDGWNRLDEAVMTGEPVNKRCHGEEQERESFLMGMYNLSMAIAPELSQKIDLSGKKKLLDVGGGPGVHAVHFCLANPGLAATVFDRPATEPFARRTAEQFGVGDRLEFAAGDFLLDPLPGGHDVAWLSQVLHSNTPDECRMLIAKTVATLEPGGCIMVHEFFLDDTMAAPRFPAVFSLNMLIGNKGRSYSESEVRRLFADCGVVGIKRLSFTGPNDSGVLMGTTP